MQALDLQIRVHGWVLQLVRDDDHDVTWGYTIGLVEHYGHPELTMLDVEPEEQHRVIRLLVNDIVTRGSVSPLTVLAEGLEIVEVHPDHLEGELFGTWGNRYGFLPPPGAMRQVLLPPSAFCACHALTIRRLDEPGPLPLPPVTPRPNRAQRRRRPPRGAGH